MFYMPMKVKTAAPSARIPAIAMGMPGTKVARPKKRKNNMVHQAAIEFGILILIFILLWETNCSSASLLIN